MTATSGLTSARSSAQSSATRADRRDALRERLQQERRELLAQLASSGVVLALTATTGSGETEHIVSGIERGVQTALDAQVEARLADVVDALDRFDRDVYGRCERCTEEIAEARLDAMPHVRLCVSCQRRADSDRRSRR